MKIWIKPNKNKDIDYSLTKKIILWLNERSVIPYIDFTIDQNSYKYILMDKSFNLKEIDYLVVLGGDGTLLSYSRIAAFNDILLLGVNLGTLGYLTYVESNDVYTALEKILRKDFKIDERSMLATKLNSKWKEEVALNDFVITKGLRTTIISITITINGIKLGCMRGDGLIISTPTGSTAYNDSAGGPILEPNARIYVLTPLCSQSVFYKPIVVSSSDIVKVKVNYRSVKKDCALLVDGKIKKFIENDEEFTFYISNKKTKLIKTNDLDFFNLYKNKIGALSEVL